MASFGLYVVSMTRQVSDILLVHLFAREGKMAEYKDDIWVSKIPASPLFETGDDLDRGGEVVKAAWVDFDVPGQRREEFGRGDSG